MDNYWEILFELRSKQATTGKNNWMEIKMGKKKSRCKNKKLALIWQRNTHNTRP